MADPKHRSETGARNRPLRAQGYDLPPVEGRRHPDRQHDRFLGQVGCVIAALVSAPIVYFLGKLFLWRQWPSMVASQVSWPAN